jgi:prepilin-type processing-associated H-X9-DG protein
MNRNWHIPAFYGYYQFNRTWPGFYEFRKAAGLPIIDQSTNSNIWTYVPRDRYCPKAIRGLTESQVKDSNGNLTPLWVVPMNYSYGMNVEGVDDLPSDPPNEGTGFDPARAPYADNKLNVAGPPARWIAFHGYKANQVRRPSEKLYIVDAMWIAVAEIGAGPDPGYLGAHSNYDLIHDVTSLANGNNPNRTTAWRHRGDFANVGFFDGHVASLHKTSIYRFDSTGKIVGNDALWKVFD